MMDRLDRMADNLTRPPAFSTVWDPQAFADLQARVAELEERLRALESKQGGAPAGTPITNP
jgi:hypothetical protein